MTAPLLLLVSWTVTFVGGVKWSTSLVGDDDFRIVSYSGMPILYSKG